MPHFDGDVNCARLGPSDTRELRGHLGQALASMGKIPLAEALSATISDANTMALRCLVHADEPAFQFVHAMLPLSISNAAISAVPLHGDFDVKNKICRQAAVSFGR